MNEAIRAFVRAPGARPWDDQARAELAELYQRWAATRRRPGHVVTCPGPGAPSRA